jgi:hypothetical protein
MTATPTSASVVVGKFDPARVFPPDDPLTLPLLRLMLAADDVRHAELLFIITNQQVNQTTGIQQVLHGGQLWYAFRLACSHLTEAGNALRTLDGSVGRDRLRRLLGGRAVGLEALERLRVAFAGEPETWFVWKVRTRVGFHYQQADIKRVFEHDLEQGKVDGSIVACEVGGLSRFTITDVLALHLVDEAAGSDLAVGGGEFARRGEEMTALAVDLFTFVDHLIDAVLEGHMDEVAREIIEVPPILRAAYDAVRKAREGGQS